MYYINRIFLQYLAKSKFLTYFLHKLWMAFCYLRSKYLHFIYFKLNKKIYSLSDRGQDRWVIDIFELKTKKYDGYFLEIGGGDGFSNSNTFVLEKYFNWDGILVEPDPDQYLKLKKNRPNVLSVNKLIYDNEKKLNFYKEGELSRVIKEGDLNNKSIINLDSIPLKKLLNQLKSPKNIDFFSLDVEGSEEKILTEDVLNEYTFFSLCIERPSFKLHELLLKKDYYFIRSNLYDYFYINKKFNNFDKVFSKRKKFTGFYDLK
jgi:FkbM family methyltransferase